MLVGHISAGTIKFQIFPIAYARHQLNSQQVGQSKNREVLTMSISVNGRRFDGGLIAHQNIEDIDCLTHATRDEMTEEQDVRIAHMMVGNASVAAIANMSLDQQVLFCQLILRP